MDGDRVGVRQLVQLVEPVVDRFVLVGAHGQGVLLRRHRGDHAHGAVEDAGGALVVVVAQLGDLIADPEHPAAVAPLGRTFGIGGQGLLEQQVEVPRSGRAAVHRAQHLHVATRVQAEPRRDPPRHDVHD